MNGYREYRSQLVRVIDGDTVEMDVDLGFRVSSRLIMRLSGINAPEMRGKSQDAGIAAKAFLSHLITATASSEKWVTVRTIQDKQEKYGRYLAVIVLEDGTTANAAMVAAGHAVGGYLERTP